MIELVQEESQTFWLVFYEKYKEIVEPFNLIYQLRFLIMVTFLLCRFSWHFRYVIYLKADFQIELAPIFDQVFDNLFVVVNEGEYAWVPAGRGGDQAAGFEH